jgi:hypothetical protein
MPSKRAQGLPKRVGPRPTTTSWAPHIQQEQLAPPAMLTALAARVFALPDIEERPIHRADPPERGLWLQDAVQKGPGDAFINEREIGHFHPWDRSMHIALPPDLAPMAVEAGWAEVHPVARAGLARKNMVMLYGPRDEHEVEVIFGIVLAAYQHAGGKVPMTDGSAPAFRKSRNSGLELGQLHKEKTQI